MSRLPHVTAIFDQGLEAGSSEAQETDRLGEQGIGHGNTECALSIQRRAPVDPWTVNSAADLDLSTLDGRYQLGLRVGQWATRGIR